MTANNTIECMLLRWGEGPSGRTVTFLLPDDPGPHPFRGLKCGPAHGQRLGAAFALISDDEATTPLEPDNTGAQATPEPGNPGSHGAPEPGKPGPQAPEKPASGTNGDGAVLPKGGRRAREAGIACGDVRFWRYLGDAFATDIMCADNAASYVRKYCGVTSRAELDHNPSAGRIWDRLHAEYLAEST